MDLMFGERAKDSVCLDSYSILYFMYQRIQTTFTEISNVCIFVSISQLFGDNKGCFNEKTTLFFFSNR